MKLELRLIGKDDPHDLVKNPRCAVLIAESAAESKALDEIFGNKVGTDGLIGRRIAECRLADGYGDHYILINAENVPTDSNGSRQQRRR